MLFQAIQTILLGVMAALMAVLTVAHMIKGVASTAGVALMAALTVAVTMLLVHSAREWRQAYKN